jgi:hypothetical protein
LLALLVNAPWRAHPHDRAKAANPVMEATLLQRAFLALTAAAAISFAVMAAPTEAAARGGGHGGGHGGHGGGHSGHSSHGHSHSHSIRGSGGSNWSYCDYRYKRKYC